MATCSAGLYCLIRRVQWEFRCPKLETGRHRDSQTDRQTTDRQTDTGLEREPPPKTLPRRLQTRHNVSPSLDPHSCAVTEGGGASLRHPVSPGCRATGTGNTSLRFSCTCCAGVFAPVSPFLFPVPVLLSPSHNYERMSVSFSSFFFFFFLNH